MTLDLDPLNVFGTHNVVFDWKAACQATSKSKRYWHVKPCIDTGDDGALGMLLNCWMIQDFKTKPTLPKAIFIWENSLAPHADFKNKPTAPSNLDYMGNIRYTRDVIRHMEMLINDLVSPKRNKRLAIKIDVKANIFDGIYNYIISGQGNDNGAWYAQLQEYTQKEKSDRKKWVGMVSGEVQALRKKLPQVKNELTQAGFPVFNFGLP